MQKPKKILFLYRTAKKKRYFEKLATEFNNAGSTTLVWGYNHSEPFKGATKAAHKFNPSELIQYAEREIFHERENVVLAKILKPLIMTFLRSQIRKIWVNLDGILNEFQPEIVVLWNGEKYQDHVFNALNDFYKFPTIRMENGLLPNTVAVDSKGVNAKNSIPRQASYYEQWYTTSIPSAIDTRPYKSSNKKINLPKRYVLIPFQMDRDSQVLYNSPWIHSMRELFMLILDILPEVDEDLHFIFREHPSSKTKYKKLYKQAEVNPRIHFDSRADLGEVIDTAEAIITLNSTVGMSSIIRGKVVLVLGDAVYGIPGLSTMVSDREQLVRNLNQMPIASFNTSLKNGFLNYLQNEYLVQGSVKEPNGKHINLIKEKILSVVSHRV